MEKRKHAIGDAWLTLGSELEQELRSRDPAARVEARIDATGLPRFQVSNSKPGRAATRGTCREYEATAAQICERCGHEVTTVRAGVVLSILCPDCTE